MAVPKRKTSKMKKGQRRSHLALTMITVAENKTTGELSRPHHISKDGYYNGKQVIIKRAVEETEEAA